MSSDSSAGAPRGAFMEAELLSQPENWERAAGMLTERAVLPANGERVAVVGCGTSWFMAQAYATLRERGGFGETDAFTASESFVDRGYDSIVAITRSGTTSEILDLMSRRTTSARTIAILGDPTTPLVDLVDDVVDLSFADEQSVVQTRFATTALAFLRSALGEDLAPVIADARAAVSAELDEALLSAEQYSFLGQGWTTGIAHEAALKMREAAQLWTESYPAMEYRHGPVAIAAPGRVTWMFGEAPRDLERDTAVTGVRFENSTLDAMADLIRAQRVALERARRAGLDPDQPRNLTRAVILTP